MLTKFIEDIRLQFRIRTNMVECKGNMKGRHKDGNYTCPGCKDEDSVEDQSHIVRCPDYSSFREGLDLVVSGDLIKYFRGVMGERMRKKE